MSILSVCYFQWIECDFANEISWKRFHVSARLLQNNAITGTIPAAVGRLEKLQTLDLSNNELTGEIPSSLGDLKNLNYL